MIKLTSVRPGEDFVLNLTFSDGSVASWSGAELLARGTVLTEPLRDPGFFRRAFVEAGALAWPNGLELSPSALHLRLAEAGALRRKAA